MDCRSAPALALVAMLACWVDSGCSGNQPCEGPVDDCVCEADADCQLTLYESFVTTESDCYSIDCACDVPRNEQAASRNEQSWQTLDCEEFAEPTGEECGDCGAGRVERAACVDSRCVGIGTSVGGTTDSQPRPEHSL